MWQPCATLLVFIDLYVSVNVYFVMRGLKTVLVEDWPAVVWMTLRMTRHLRDYGRCGRCLLHVGVMCVNPVTAPGVFS